MFSDLVGSTSLAATLDTEDWRDLVGAYLDDAGKAIGQYGGHVAKKLGDMLIALFGYPRTQENYAERSVKERGTTLPKPCCTQPDARVRPAAGFFSCFRCNQLKKVLNRPKESQEIQAFFLGLTCSQLARGLHFQSESANSSRAGATRDREVLAFLGASDSPPIETGAAACQRLKTRASFPP
jgi:hypothetical protein